MEANQMFNLVRPQEDTSGTGQTILLNEIDNGYLNIDTPLDASQLPEEKYSYAQMM